MAELKLQQQQDNVTTIPANLDDNFVIKAHNAHLIHALLEVPAFNAQTGKRLSKPWIQSFTKRKFEQMVKENAFRGHTVYVIHNPDVSAKGKKIPLGETLNNDEDHKQNDQSYGASGNEPKEKTLDKMNKEELLKKYFDLFGDPAGEELDTKAKLIVAIEAKMSE